MMLTKGKRTVERKSFICRNRNQFNFSACVREFVLPHKYVKVELDKDKNIVFTPSDDPNDYACVISNYQMKVGACALSNLISIENGKRLYCERLGDGRILCHTQQKPLSGKDLDE